MLARASPLMVAWKFKSTDFANLKVTSPYDILPTALVTDRPKTRSFPFTPTVPQTIAALKAVDANLTTELAELTDSNIASLEANPLTLPFPSPVSVSGVQISSIKVGSVEAYAVRSAIRAVKGLVDTALAYNMDSGNFNLTAQFNTVHATAIANGTALTPDMYLPPSPYMVLNSDGVSRFRDLGTQWNGAANDANSLITVLQARTGSGWLINSGFLSIVDYASLQAYIQEFKAAISGPVGNVPINDSNGDAATVTVDLSAWISKGAPPHSLRPYLPTLLPMVDSGTGFTLLMPVAGSIADSTYDGLFPSAVPDVILYNWTINISDPTTTNLAVIIHASDFGN